MNVKLILSDITSSAGTERATINLANNLSKHGYLVTILSLYTTQGTAYFNLNDSVVIKHLHIRTSRFLILRILGFFKTFSVLSKNVPQNSDIVLGTNHVHNFILSLLCLFKPTNKYIGCEHLSYSALTPYSKFLVKLLYRRLDAVVVLTDVDKLNFNKNVPTVLCETIPNELSFYPPDPSPCDNKILLAIGRYTYQKGFDLLIDLAALALKDNPGWVLNIVGDGELKNDLTTQITRYDLRDRIFLIPPTKNILDFFLESSIYLMTSRYEGLPMVLLEAKACGLPVIAYDCPTGPRELIKDDDGILIQMNDSEAFLKNLLLLIGDESKRKQLGRNARVNSMDYNSDTVYQKWESLFSKL
ncbi:glycosyltransferase family 4 protein [Mucilaginibacter sp. L3T2-6]|uniref:glycosyltransferase family 4 protein n=1 Tax=Mucilaginibacter sp. L3T2-6 TaxID=3062491 RepID=UPI0026771502|nr:glycosyltransferase family 4 protein [Mucilaginibacter sp. L3T2-6]MDO3642471.1 glycosyltransferase family 4 protein [Mucilaginibacter sp. L3T2-6]MDV6215133.1 glycosyltransferase family 4 protein [Mucilaginibacter sp. L3T2-6]